MEKRLCTHARTTLSPHSTSSYVKLKPFLSFEFSLLFILSASTSTPIPGTGFWHWLLALSHEAQHPKLEPQFSLLKKEMAANMMLTKRVKRETTEAKVNREQLSEFIQICFIIHGALGPANNKKSSMRKS